MKPTNEANKQRWQWPKSKSFRKDPEPRDKALHELYEQHRLIDEHLGKYRLGQTKNNPTKSM